MDAKPVRFMEVTFNQGSGVFRSNAGVVVLDGVDLSTDRAQAHGDKREPNQDAKLQKKRDNG